MKTILEKNRNRDKNVNSKGVTDITLWGLYDTISWRASCSPLLFDTGITDPKASFYEFINAAKSMGGQEVTEKKKKNFSAVLHAMRQGIFLQK